MVTIFNQHSFDIRFHLAQHVWLIIVVSLFCLWQPWQWQLPEMSEFVTYFLLHFPPKSFDCIELISTPRTPTCIPIDCCVVCVCIIVAFLCPIVSFRRWYIILSHRSSSSDFDRYGGWIDAADTAAGHVDVGHVVDGVRGGWADRWRLPARTLS